MQLPARHINFFANVSRAEFNAAVSALDAAIPTLTDYEVVTGMARMVALARDAHTNINLPQAAVPTRRVPLRLTWFQDGLFVTAASAEFAKALGARVVSIGGMTTEQAYQAVSAVIGHENDAWLRYLTPSYLVNADLLKALQVIPDGSVARFVFGDLTGARFELDLPSSYTPTLTLAAPDPSTGFTPLHRRNQSQFYWFSYFPTTGLLYLKYNVCRDMTGQSFAQFTQQVLAALDSNPVNLFIADIRGNTGGDSSVINPLLTGLNQRASRFRSSTRLDVFIDEGTISSGLMAAEALRDLGFATLYGAPTGGSPNHFGNISTLTLPNFQVSVNYSTRRFTYPLATDSLLPDVPAPVRSADYFARFDPVIASVVTSPIERIAPVKIAVLNAASFEATVSPGALASAFGDFSGVASADASAVPYSKSLGGVEVLVNGIRAPLLAVRASQINFQVPRATPPGPAEIRVLHNGAELARDNMNVANAAPGIFIIGAADISRPGAVLNQDFRVNGETLRARRGDVIQIFATGQGPTDPAAEDGAAGGSVLSHSTIETHGVLGVEPAEIIFSGLSPLFPGVWQVNLRVPDQPSVAGQMPLFLYQGNTVSNAVTVWIE
ncbi:MAG TPA: hypothetical protein VGP79_03455 [Bryobacteraceae bacterium]|nr:hypothetical protein [Bryobacteraceae bacterium]